MILLIVGRVLTQTEGMVDIGEGLLHAMAMWMNQATTRGGSAAVNELYRGILGSPAGESLLHDDNYLHGSM